MTDDEELLPFEQAVARNIAAVVAAEVAAEESLRRIVAAIDAGEVEAPAGQRAYLLGAADTLGALSAPEDAEGADPSGNPA